jgi:hypothetical protein
MKVIYCFLFSGEGAVGRGLKWPKNARKFSFKEYHIGVKAAIFGRKSTFDVPRESTFLEYYVRWRVQRKRAHPDEQRNKKKMNNEMSRF